MFLQTTLTFADGSSQSAHATKDCSINEAKNDLFAVIAHASRLFEQTVVQFRYRIVNFDSAEQMLIEGVAIGDGDWKTQVQFIDCSEQRAQELLAQWAGTASRLH
jgi:hypothetical protein